MIKFIKKELEIEESLKQRIMIICDFCNTTPTIINGSIRKIDKTNLTYIEPHRIIIKDNLMHIYDYQKRNYKDINKYFDMGINNLRYNLEVEDE